MKKIDLDETTRKIFRFRPDEAYTVEEVLGQFRRWRAEAFQCRRGEVCLKAGAPAREFLVIGSGQLHIKQPSEFGDDVLVRVAGPGDYVGLSLIYTRAKEIPFDVVAASSSAIILFNVDEVRKWRTDPKSQPLFDFIGHLMGEIINESQTRVMILCGQDIAERLRRWLAVQMERNHTRTVALPGTCADLAKYLGVSRFALSRTIHHLQDEGRLEFKRNVFTVLG